MKRKEFKAFCSKEYFVDYTRMNKFFFLFNISLSETQSNDKMNNKKMESRKMDDKNATDDDNDTD